MADDKSNDSFLGLSTAAFIGIGISLLVIIALLIVIIIVLICCCLRKNKKDRTEADTKDPKMRRPAGSCGVKTSSAMTTTWGENAATVMTTPSQVDQQFTTQTEVTAVGDSKVET